MRAFPPTAVRRYSAALAVAGALVLASAAMAADGDPDVGFNGSGTLVTDLGGALDHVNSMAVQPDGKLVVAGIASGDFALARFHPDGTLDTSFSPGGVPGKFAQSYPGGGSDPALDLEIQPDGKIVAVGTKVNSGAGTGNDFILVRLGTTGEPDPSFDGAAGIGDGEDGILTVNLGPGASDDNAEALDFSGSDIVVGGTRDADGVGVGVGDSDFMAARFNSNGQLDTAGFNAGTGFNTVSVGTSDAGQDVEVTAAGRVVIGGLPGGATSWAFAAFDSAGILDPTFSPGGTPGLEVFNPTGASGGPASIEAIAEQADGKLVFTGIARFSGLDGDLAVARTDAVGVPDAGFDGDGFVRTELSAADNDSGVGIEQQADGKLLVGATIGPGLDSGDGAVVRYLATGALDTAGFSTGAPAGIATVDIGPGNAEVGNDLALSPAGLAYWGGYSDDLPQDAPLAGIAAFRAHPPPTPAGLTTDPPSGANNNSPRLMGTAATATTVSVFSNGTCSGSPLVTGTGIEFNGPGLPFSVADNTTTTLSATSTSAGLPSGCSAAITYAESTPPPTAGSGPAAQSAPAKKCKKGRKLKKGKCVKKKRKKK